MSLVKFITHGMPKSSLFLLFMPIFHRIFFTGTSLICLYPVGSVLNMVGTLEGTFHLIQTSVCLLIQVLESDISSI